MLRRISCISCIFCLTQRTRRFYARRTRGIRRSAHSFACACHAGHCILELQNIQILRLLRFSRETNIRVDTRDTPEPNIIREIRVFKKPNPFSKKV